MGTIGLNKCLINDFVKLNNQAPRTPFFTWGMNFVSHLVTNPFSREQFSLGVSDEFPMKREANYLHVIVTALEDLSIYLNWLPASTLKMKIVISVNSLDPNEVA